LHDFYFCLITFIFYLLANPSQQRYDYFYSHANILQGK
jgi:hypothetical protein